MAKRKSYKRTRKTNKKRIKHNKTLKNRRQRGG